MIPTQLCGIEIAIAACRPQLNDLHIEKAFRTVFSFDTKLPTGPIIKSGEAVDHVVACLKEKSKSSKFMPSSVPPANSIRLCSSKGFTIKAAPIVFQSSAQRVV